MRAVVRVFLAFPTKSIGGCFKYQELLVRKLFIFEVVHSKKFFPKFEIMRMGNTGLLEKKLGGHVSRQASSTCQSARWTRRGDGSDVSLVFWMLDSRRSHRAYGVLSPSS